MRLSSAVVIVALLGALGCAPSNPGIDIEGLAPADDTCGFVPATDRFLGRGLLDTDAATITARGGIRYIAAIQIANHMMNRGSFVYPLMSDANTWHAMEAEVELRGLDGRPLADLGDLPPRFRVPVSGAIVPSANSVEEPGRGIVFAEVVPAVYGDQLADREGTLVVAVRVTGTTAGDSTQQTGELTFNVTLCRGCLQQCVLDEQCRPSAAASCLSTGQDRFFSFCTAAQLDACRMAMMP